LVSLRPEVSTSIGTDIPGIGVIDGHYYNIAHHKTGPRVTLSRKDKNINKRMAGIVIVECSPCCRSGKLMDPEVIYCQSNPKFINPSPSLPSVPPNRFVMTFTAPGDALCVARQTMEIPLRRGKIYAGKISYTNMTQNAIQNTLKRLELLLTSK
jgi:hypothetical protein